MTTPPRTVLLFGILALALLQLYAGLALRECQKKCDYAVEQAETARLEVLDALHPIGKALREARPAPPAPPAPEYPKEPKENQFKPE